VLQRIAATPDLSLGLLVTGMHLDPVHGETWQELVADGFDITERVPGHIAGDTLAAMAASIGNYLVAIAAAIERHRPDILLVLGDRGEQLAGAIAAAYQNVIVVHLCGGSLSGSIDDSVRHAITKFAHFHLPALAEHANRIVQMGEDPATVLAVGLPGADIRNDVAYSRAEICGQYDVPLDEPYLLVIQHSVTHAHQDAEKQITETLEAIIASGHHALLANPNDDAGGRVIIEKINTYAGKQPRLHQLEPPRSRTLFASIMAHAAVQIGNSSSALFEAMSVSLPVVNIGDRQRGREHLGCLLNVGYDRREILQAIETALDPNYRRQVIEFAERLSQQDTPAKVVNCLQQIDLDLARRPKTFFNLPS
jgi:UDP-N-acetylglucosamine 2-epimerase (non-hydrolysing)/GDP/UDP-N,N'-diacetylbacillosamine 2-epimerase (hydrolysing)